MKDGSVGYTGLNGLGNDIRDSLYEEGILFHSPIPKFLESSTFYVDVQEEQVHYFYEREIPDVKMTIVSATINEKLYINYCRGRYVHYVDVPLVQYQGKLVQYTAHSMSRSCIDNFGYDKVRENILQITQNPDINWITFRKFDASGGIYFGKTEGFNHYKGQDLVVLGTPHNVPFLYILIGKHLGYQVEDVQLVSMGAINTCPGFIPEIFKAALLSNAANILLFHNHPSGDVTPSKEDIQLTRRVVKAGKLLGIPLQDHIILGEDDDFYSFRKSGGFLEGESIN